MTRLPTRRSALGLFLAVIAVAATLSTRGAIAASTPHDGIVKVKGVYGFDKTITRLKQDIEKKGIMFFSAVDQAKLGAGANIMLLPSTLLIFGNPPLGIQFLTSNPNAGLGWTGPSACSAIRTTKDRFGPSTRTLLGLRSATALPTGTRSSRWHPR